MLSPGRALNLNAESGRRLPQVPAFADLYRQGMDPRHGQVIMVAGRSGSQKSGFVMFWVDEMNLPTIYFSGDMSPFTASARIASKRMGMTTDQVEKMIMAGGSDRAKVLAEADKSPITFAFGSPITWRNVENQINAYVEAFDRLPECLVFDNLMDIEGAQAEYSEQMDAMQGITELAREIGATTFVTHHASDKSWDARREPFCPPSRQEIKGGMSEKPELSLSVALDPNSLDFNVAVVKQRSGPQDPTAKRWVTLRAEPDKTRFHSVSLRH